MTEAARQRAYINRVLERTGWTQSDLAARAGLDPSTLSRFLSASRPGHALRPRSLGKIEAVSGIHLNSEDGAPDVTGVAAPSAGFAESEAAPLVAAPNSDMAVIIQSLSRNRMNVDPWVLRSRALEGTGYRPGDVLIVALGETALSGDVVCAQIYDWTTGQAETLFRIFQPPYLVAASGDSQFIRPLVVDGNRVIIKGVVIHTIRGRQSDL